MEIHSIFCYKVKQELNIPIHKSILNTTDILVIPIDLGDQILIIGEKVYIPNKNYPSLESDYILSILTPEFVKINSPTFFEKIKVVNQFEGSEKEVIQNN